MEADEAVAAVLPVVDLSPMWSEDATKDDTQKVVHSVARACESVGMFYATCTPAQALAAERALRSSDTLFGLSEQQKRSITPAQPSPSAARGYLGVGAESGGAQLELKEQFSYGTPLSTVSPHTCSLVADNIWPEDVLDDCGPQGLHIRPDFEAFSAVAEQVACAVGRALAIALSDPSLSHTCSDGGKISFTRCFHYLPAVCSLNAEQTRPAPAIGSSPHTDWGFCTVIAQRNAPGAPPALEVDIDGNWVAVPDVEGTFIVNCGDYMELMSEGRFKSPLHRVTLTPFERTSFVYFHYPRYDVPFPERGAAVARASKRYLSVLQDQSPETETTVAEAELPLPALSPWFGDHIAKKWTQVVRT